MSAISHILVTTWLCLRGYTAKCTLATLHRYNRYQKSVHTVQVKKAPVPFLYNGGSINGATCTSSTVAFLLSVLLHIYMMKRFPLSSVSCRTYVYPV